MSLENKEMHVLEMFEAGLQVLLAELHGDGPEDPLPEPELQLTMCKMDDFSEDDETIILSELYEFFHKKLVPHPINLHLCPELFAPGPLPGKEKMTIVRLEEVTPVTVFDAVESYYQEIGAPDTDHRFVESLTKVRGSKSPEDCTIFMGS